MNCSTWQKFQGAWLSSVLITIRQQEKGLKYSKNWLFIRKEIVDYVVKASRLNINSSKSLEQFLSIADEDNAERDSKPFQLNQAISLEQEKLVKHEDIILCLLPLIIFSGDNQELLRELLDNCILKSLVTLEEQEDILIWSRLLSLSFNCNQDGSVNQIIKQVLNGLRVEKSALPNNLEMVIRAQEQGLGLYQLAEELHKTDNPSQIAISLAAYCFASTPRHFELAIKRIENVSLSKNWLATALTATLSGAYNGVAGIPWSWRASANKQQIYRSESQLAAKLFEVWLGIYSPEKSSCSYSQEFDAIAQVKVIQTRQALKIISQNNT